MLLTNIDDLRMDASDFADAVKDYEPSTLEYLGAKLGSGFDYTTTSSVLLEGRVQVAQYGQDLPGLNMDEIKASPYFRPEIKYEDGWTAERLRIYAEDYDQRAYEKWIISQHDTGFISGIAGFGAMLMGNLPDPLNAVPFGRGLSLAGKGLGAAAKRGVIEGVLSSAVADAVVLPDLYTRGEDVGYADFVLDLSFGAALGGLLGGVGGSVGNKRQAWIDAKVREALADAGQDTGMGTGVVQDAFPRNELADTMRMHASPETRQVVSRAMEKALLDFHDGRDVDVEDIFKGTDTLNQLEHHTVVGALESGEFADVDFGSLHQGHKEAPDVGVIDDPLAPGIKPGDGPEALVRSVEKETLYNDDRSVKIVFTKTEADFSATDRGQLRTYLKSIDPVGIKALKLKDQSQYVAVLRSIVRKIFPRGGELRFRKESEAFDYGHLLKDSTRCEYIATLPKTLKDNDIHIEFKTPEGERKAYEIKKYFDQETQKDIWDMLIFRMGS